MLLKQKSSESQLKSVPVLTLWTKKLDFVPKIIKKRLQDLYFVLTLTDGIFELGQAIGPIWDFCTTISIIVEL